MSRKSRIDKFLVLSEYLVSDTADLFILLADLVGSTEYKQSLLDSKAPDITWISRQLIFLQRAKEIIEKAGGIIIKTIGDEIMASFDPTSDPIKIINCSIEIIQSFENIKSFQGNSKIETKISLDVGLTYNGSITPNIKFDPIGLPVDRCARLNSEAEKDEIIFSEDFFNTICQRRKISTFRKKFHTKKIEKELKGIGQTTFFKIFAK
jgi:class 3 adenylate cyclase